MRKLYILELKELCGEDVDIQLMNEGEPVDTLYCIISVGENGAHIVDNGYRSIKEAQDAWPEAQAPTESQAA